MLYNAVINRDIDLIINNSSILKKYENTTVVVTGGTGLIASYLICLFDRLNSLKNANIRIYVNVRSEERFKTKMGYDDYRFSIIEKSVQDIEISDFDGDKIDYIFHLAGSSSPYAIRNTPTEIIEANVNGTFAVLAVAKFYSSKVFYSSTREVYGETHGIMKLKESNIGVLDQTLLRSCYPESKRMAENLLISYQSEYKVNFVIARIAHLYGPSMAISNDGRIMSDLLGNVCNNEDIELISDGSALRAFCYISDAIEAILLMTIEGNNEVYNLSNENEEISILDLSRLLISLVPEHNLNVTYKEVDKNQQSGYLNFERVGLDTSKLENLKWKPKVNLKDGLLNSISYFHSD